MNSFPVYVLSFTLQHICYFLESSTPLLPSFYPKSYLKAVFGCHFSAFRLNQVDSFITKIPLSSFYYMILYQNLKKPYYICTLTAVFLSPCGLVLAAIAASSLRNHLFNCFNIRVIFICSKIFEHLLKLCYFWGLMQRFAQFKYFGVFLSGYTVFCLFYETSKV